MQTQTDPIITIVILKSLLADFLRLEYADSKTADLKGRALHSAIERVRKKQATFEKTLLECHDKQERSLLMSYLRSVTKKQVGDLTIHDIFESLETT